MARSSVVTVDQEFFFAHAPAYERGNFGYWLGPNGPIFAVLNDGKYAVMPVQAVVDRLNRGERSERDLKLEQKRVNDLIAMSGRRK